MQLRFTEGDELGPLEAVKSTISAEPHVAVAILQQGVGAQCADFIRHLMQQPHLFAPFSLRGLMLPNRIVVSPMCQYSSDGGFANDWHFVHLASRAIGGAALILTEATAVLPEGRISPRDLGLWSDEHVPALARITAFLRGQGVVPGVQLAHAGRKASMSPPWEQTRLLPPAKGGWENVVAPSAISFNDQHATPLALTLAGIDAIQQAFVDATHRALRAGFACIELHAAHGYLFHQLLSTLSNRRTDQYGGSFENRCRFLLETVERVRAVWPADLPLLVRVSATDWLEFDDGLSAEEQGWRLADTLRLAVLLREQGVDLLDVSSGGNAPQAKIPTGAGYQTSFAEQVRRHAGIPTAAVGLITSPEQADHVIRSGQADMVMLAREMLRQPYWPLHAAEVLKQEISWPVQYVRAAGGRKPARLAIPERTI